MLPDHLADAGRALLGARAGATRSGARAGARSAGGRCPRDVRVRSPGRGGCGRAWWHWRGGLPEARHDRSGARAARAARPDRSGPHRCGRRPRRWPRAARSGRRGGAPDRRLVRRLERDPSMWRPPCESAARGCRWCCSPARRCSSTDAVDLILFLSLVSGRNPQYLIEEHVRAVPFLQRHPVPTVLDRLHPDRRRPGHERRGREPDAAAPGGQAGARRRARRARPT